MLNQSFVAWQFWKMADLSLWRLSNSTYSGRYLPSRKHVWTLHCICSLHSMKLPLGLVLVPIHFEKIGHIYEQMRVRLSLQTHTGYQNVSSRVWKANLEATEEIL